MKAIEARDLTRRFGDRVAVDGLNLSIDRGEFFALLGTNGAGKTTTIRMLCCLLAPSGGDALVLGHSIAAEPARIKPLLNLSPQETAVAPNLTVRENLELIAMLYGQDKATARASAAEMMGRLGLTEREKDRAKSLSGGMQRRLSIAMALISRPQLLFLDEPTLGLDVRARRELWQVLRALKGQITIVLTTHYMEEAEALSDRIGIMHAGRLQAVGTAEALTAQAGQTSFEDAFLALTEQEVLT